MLGKAEEADCFFLGKELDWAGFPKIENVGRGCWVILG
jgi:hypothetical protein